MGRIWLLVVAIVLPSCGGGEDKKAPGADVSPDKDMVWRGDVGDVGGDEGQSQDVALPDGQSVDTLVEETTTGDDTHVEPGAGQLGDPCESDGDCESTLCWVTYRGSGCTIPCETQADCQAVGPLVCMWVREGKKGCALMNGEASSQCTQSAQCPYPTVCIAEFSWCDLPECTFDKECATGSQCKAGFRVCETQSCQSTYECKNPLEFCHDEVCGPGLCEKRSDCAPGEVCNLVQGECQTSSACDAEGKCSYYNEICVDALCEPNRCVIPCSHAGDICNPSTGKCGPACSGTTGCAGGWGCDVAAGVCYVNNPPVAIAKVEKGGVLMDAANSTVGSAVKLVGHLSVDPEGMALQYIWTLIDIPAGTQLTPGGPFSDLADATFTPTVAGLYQFGLRVQDDSGVPSAQAQATVWVK